MGNCLKSTSNDDLTLLNGRTNDSNRESIDQDPNLHFQVSSSLFCCELRKFYIKFCVIYLCSEFFVASYSGFRVYVATNFSHALNSVWGSMSLKKCENYIRKSLSLSDANHLFINQITKNCEEKKSFVKRKYKHTNVSGASVWLESRMFRFVSMFLSRDSIINCEKVSLCNDLINEEAPKLRVSPFHVHPPCNQLDKDKLVADLLDRLFSSMLDRTRKKS